MTTHHRDGTRSHAHQTIQTQSKCNAYCHTILYNHQNGNQHYHHQQRLSTQLDSLEICLKTHGGKEEHHEKVLQRTIETDLEQPQHITQQGKHGKQQATHHR